VGIVGENTSDMIKLLMDQAVTMQRDKAKKQIETQARDKVRKTQREKEST
jgi:ATP-dependent protease HslVU (ClpYQ) ATPase subunit